MAKKGRTELQTSNFRAYVIGGMSKGSMGGTSPARRRRATSTSNRSSSSDDLPF